MEGALHRAIPSACSCAGIGAQQREVDVDIARPPIICLHAPPDPALERCVAEAAQIFMNRTAGGEAAGHVLDRAVPVCYVKHEVPHQRECCVAPRSNKVVAHRVHHSIIHPLCSTPHPWPKYHDLLLRQRGQVEAADGAQVEVWACEEEEGILQVSRAFMLCNQAHAASHLLQPHPAAARLPMLHQLLMAVVVIVAGLLCAVYRCPCGQPARDAQPWRLGGSVVPVKRSLARADQKPVATRQLASHRIEDGGRERGTA
mmetsp:Transcript_157/g.346  ORF Transcript_157/g.346 Transcript_157/m.346 type:complete len:258 (+) Transcript_157:237-1010(+)